MKKYLPYIFLIIALAVAAVWFINHQSKGTINEQEGDFAVKNPNDIFRIVLDDTEKNKVELTNTNGVWMVNGKYAAREELTKQLLEAITQITSLCPVPSAAHDNVIRELMAHHVQVQIFDKKNKLLKSYWIGGPSVDGQSTYTLLEDNGTLASRPQLAYVPGFKGYLTPRFNTNEETWRTRVVYNYAPGEIKSLQVEYPADEKNSFTITGITKDSFSLSPLNEEFRIKNSYQQKYIKQYLGFYSSVFLEAYDNNYSTKDSVIKTTPYCTITITENDNSVNKVNLFYMPINKRSKSQFDEKGNERTYDLDHYFASIHKGQDFAIVQYYVFGKILRNYPDFFFKPS